MDVFGDASTGYWSYVGFYYEFFTAYEQGLLSIELYIPATDILNSVYDEYTNFELWITLVDAMTWYELEFLGPVYTSWYYLSDFEPALSWIEAVYDYGEDTDGNGLTDHFVTGIGYDQERCFLIWSSMEVPPLAIQTTLGASMSSSPIQKLV